MPFDISKKILNNFLEFLETAHFIKENNAIIMKLV